MILLTVGTQLAFDRLTAAVDEWLVGVDVEVVGQIGLGTYVPKRFRYQDFFNPSELEDLFSSADLIISHAGMGTIISALTRGKPIVIVPRRADLGEHRNDHQIATARKFSSHRSVKPVFDVGQLDAAISELLSAGAGSGIPQFAPDPMISELRKLIG
jgi:Uncharacterized conserved protein